jgi:hypothetical protein
MRIEERTDRSLLNDTTLTADGLLRWKSNDQVPPAEYVERAYALGMAVNPTLCAQVRTTELRAFLAEYRKNDRPMSAEEMAEARAAHGPGTTLVNIITGRRTKL